MLEFVIQSQRVTQLRFPACLKAAMGAKGGTGGSGAAPNKQSESNGICDALAKSKMPKLK